MLEVLLEHHLIEPVGHLVRGTDEQSERRDTGGAYRVEVLAEPPAAFEPVDVAPGAAVLIEGGAAGS
jgi:hypothetical protein